MAFLKNINRSQFTDDELISGYKFSGSMEQLGELYSRYMDLAYGVCLKYLKDRQPAQDAVLQVFEELVEKLKRHQPQNFRSWLYTVVKNHCLMQLRKKGAAIVSLEADIMQSEEELHPEDMRQQEMQLTNLSGCIETLAAEQKRSVQLFYLEDKCYKEIGNITGLDLNKVRSLIQNGRRNLKICMEQRTEKKYAD